jgi:hypothetical protein
VFMIAEARCSEIGVQFRLCLRAMFLRSLVSMEKLELER